MEHIIAVTKSQPSQQLVHKGLERMKELIVSAEKLQQSLGVESRRKRSFNSKDIFFYFLKNFWHVFYDQIMFTFKISNGTSHHEIIIEYDVLSSK